MKVVTKCDCSCHTDRQTVHIQPCCDNGLITTYEPEPFTPETNALLKEMWRIDEKMRANPSYMFEKSSTITEEEVRFYRKNKGVIRDYYKDQADYWRFNDNW